MSLPKKLHEAYARFFEEPTREALRDLLRGQVGELNQLDFKEQWPEGTKLAKHILALANSGGGALIVGTKQEKDGSIDPIGLAQLTDKTDIANKTKAFLPPMIRVEVLDFAYKDSEYPTLKGKSFQVLIVEDVPEGLPYLSNKTGEGIKSNTVYVRDGTSTTEADHNNLQKIINRRIETGHSSSKTLELKEHISQLKVLNAERPAGQSALARLFMENAFNLKSTKEIDEFLESLYQRKKRQIEKLLQL